MAVSSDSDRATLNAVANRDGMTGLSSKNEDMRHCLELARIACHSPAPVMLIGEAGVGKSLLAMSIHYTSPRRARPCITLNCSAVGEDDIRYYLFGEGHNQPSRNKGDGGLVARAGDGTLIIDAVDLLPGFVQQELLTLLMGANRSAAGASQSRFEARLISTRGSELSQKAATGLFVAELMYCLGEITIRIPPLRERREDLPDLTIQAVQAANQANGRQVTGLSHTASDFIAHYDFPGNIRELFLIINRAVRETLRDTIYVEDLGLVVDGIEEDPHMFSDMTLLPLAEMEKRHIAKALLRTGWKRRAAARILRISEIALDRKIRLHCLERGVNAGCGLPEMP